MTLGYKKRKRDLSREERKRRCETYPVDQYIADDRQARELRRVLNRQKRFNLENRFGRDLEPPEPPVERPLPGRKKRSGLFLSLLAAISGVFKSQSK